MAPRSLWNLRGLSVVLLLLCCLSVPCAWAQLTAAVWLNTAFAPDAAAALSVAPAATLAGLALGGAYASVRLSGTVTPALADAALNFSAASEGGVRLWVDDFLLIDAGALHEANGSSAAGRAAFQTISVAAGVPLAFRLEYSRWPSGAPPLLQLFWQGAATPRAEVPPGAFAPASSAAQLARAALRDRLVAPSACPWQTHFRRSAVAHTLAPTGLVLYATLVDAVAGVSMGDIIVQRGGGPYLSRAGLHSRNGSDYTSFNVWAWRGLDCNVTFETAVAASSSGGNDGGNGGGAQLQFLASSSGADCARLRLLVQPVMFEERVGSPAPSSSGGGFVVALPGFPDAAVAPAGAAPVPINASVAPTGVPYFALPLGPAAAVGYCSQVQAQAQAQVQAHAQAHAQARSQAPGAEVLSCPPVAEMAANIASARARAAAASASFGALAEVFEGIASSILWTTVFCVQEGVIAIVSRNPNWAGNYEFVADYVLFEWDSYFIALQASVEPGALRDVGLSTLLQVTLARTPRGFVPNWKSGSHSSNDRSENQVGALVARRVLAMLPPEERAWVAELLFPPLLTWHEWVWSSRMALGGALAGEPLFVLGSDPAEPHDNGNGNIQGARYESMDNSPCYDAPPVFFNASTHAIEQYDVSPTALFLSDAEALAAIAVDAGRGDVVPLLHARFAAAAAALNAHLWLEDVPPAGAYANRLFNGSFYARLAPPSLFPLISGAASDAQALALAQLAASPRGFCVNATHTPGAGVPTGLVTRWAAHGEQQRSTSCVSAACTSAALLSGRASFEAVEASVPMVAGASAGAGRGAGAGAALPPAPPFAGAIALNLYLSAALGNLTALATAPPDETFALVRQEAWCFSAPPLPGGPNFRAWPLTNLTLWTLAAAPRDFVTCGTAACAAAAAAAGYVLGGDGSPMCLAFDASDPDTLPCVVPVPSIARADPSFLDQDYWRGRAWAPQAMLVYLALLRYDHLAPLRAARADLVAMGKAVFLAELREFGHVAENYNALTGFTQDSGDADPYYAWGGLWALMAVLEAGFGGGALNSGTQAFESL